MYSLKRCVVDFLCSEDGPTAVEYAVMLAFMLIVFFTAIATVGSNTNNSYSASASSIKGKSS